jgi:hypothetical protein
VRPTPIPDAEIWPGAVRLVLAAPSGDLTGDGSSVDQAAAVEILVDRGQNTGAPRCCVRFELESGDLEKLTAGGTVWLSVYGRLPVFCMDVKGPGE